MSEKKRQSLPKDFLQTCIVCCHVIDNVKRFNTVGMCGHVGCCSLCSLRMRQLLDNKTCTICKSELPRVICTRNSSETFESYQDWGDNIGPRHVFDDISGIFFLKEDYNQVHAMRDTMCRKCNSKFPSLNALKSHMLEAHQLHFCNICLDHKKVFLQEHELFTKDALKRHATKGNPKHGFSGHPRCDFCQSRHYSNTELYDHLHKHHYECDICVRSYGVENRYYKDYHDLENHFRAEHFLCEEHVCLMKKFVVFKTHIDFQAHMSKEHPHIKTNKKLDVHFKIKRATRDGSGMTHDREQGDEYQQYPSADNLDEVNNDVINVADFPSLSGSNGSVQLHLWESQRVTTPTIDDFPELPQSTRLSNIQLRGTTGSAFRNALAPPPTPAMIAHMRNDDSWEYPDIANAAEALGTNNPLLRFVKPSKKKKSVKAKKEIASNDLERNNESLLANGHSISINNKQDLLSTNEVKVDSTDGREISKSALILKIRQTLGSDEKYEQFREECKKFRLREIDVDIFHTDMTTMFSPGDFEHLFLNLLSLLPDKERSKEFFQYHHTQKDTNRGGKGLGSQEKKKDNASFTQRQSNARSSTPARSGWANALRQSGFSAPQLNPQNPKVLLNNPQTLKATRNSMTWKSDTNWEALSSSSSHQVASGIATTSSENSVVDTYPSLPKEDVEEKVPNPILRTNSSSFKATRNDFPALPSAGKPVGVQPVTRATWDEQFQTIAQTGNQNNSKKGGGKKKQKKKSMTLGELAMKFS